MFATDLPRCPSDPPEEHPAMHPATQRYVTYKRVSTAEQGRSGLGLDAQERDLKLFLENYSEVPYEIIGEFTDVLSGTDSDRPELTKAIDLAKRTDATVASVR